MTAMASPELLALAVDEAENDWEIEVVETISSTNQELSRRFSNVVSTPHIILWAEEQTDGRGRLNRTWVSEKGKDISSSICFPSPVKVPETPKLSILAGISLCRILKGSYGINARVRWPNDVMVNDTKVAGILCAYLGKPDAVICGTGINVNSEPGIYDFGEGRSYTTIKAILGREIERERLYGKWLIEYEKSWALGVKEKPGELRSEFDKFNYYNGISVEVYSGAGEERERIKGQPDVIGVADSIDESGALLVKESGRMYRVEIDDVIVPIE
jgi:BirA family biotin operon repressor/biotin-[acetyl-CoA-carboxylase] ligase